MIFGDSLVNGHTLPTALILLHLILGSASGFATEILFLVTFLFLTSLSLLLPIFKIPLPVSHLRLTKLQVFLNFLQESVLQALSLGQIRYPVLFLSLHRSVLALSRSVLPSSRAARARNRAILV